MELNVQKDLIYEQIPSKDKLLKHSSLFLISSSWWENWVSYVNNTSSYRPDAIDNSSLLLNHSLHPDLTEADYELIPEKAWAFLVSWYTGGPAIELLLCSRESLLQSVHIQVSKYADYCYCENPWVDLYVPCKSTLFSLKSSICDKFSISLSSSTLQQIEEISQGKPKIKILAIDELQTIESAEIQNGCKIIVETNSPDEEDTRSIDKNVSTGMVN